MGNVVEWDHLPQDDDDLPEWPDWAEYREDDHYYWATRFNSTAYGVDVVPERPALCAYGRAGEPSPPHVEVIIIDAAYGWEVDSAIREEVAEDLDAALALADTFRDCLASIGLRWCLQ